MDEGEKIRKLRELRGFKQSTMARALGLSTKAYGKTENERNSRCPNYGAPLPYRAFGSSKPSAPAAFSE